MKKQKILAIALALSMTAGLPATTAWAADEQPELSSDSGNFEPEEETEIFQEDAADTDSEDESFITAAEEPDTPKETVDQADNNIFSAEDTGNPQLFSDDTGSAAGDDTAQDITLVEPKLDSYGYYQISTVEELYWFANEVNVNGKYNLKADLVDDITVNEGDVAGYDGTSANDWLVWKPIGTQGYGNGNQEFSGVFRGNGHTISGLFCTQQTTRIEFVGFTGCLSGYICDLNIDNSYIESEEGVGGFSGEITSGGKVERCTFDGTVIASYRAGGGIAGSNGGSIVRCINNGNIHADQYGGGICGLDAGSIITSCINTGDVTGTYLLGGICGITADEYKCINNCYSVGNVTGKSLTDGICGDLSAYIYNCYYNNDIYTGTGVNSGSTGMSTEDFISGKVCWLLQQGEKSNVWHQNLSDVSSTPDELPVFDSLHSSVFQVTCEGDGVQAITYANSNFPKVHHWQDGLCQNCQSRKPLTSTSVNIESISPEVYCGEAIEPDITITDENYDKSENELIPDEDYEVYYSNNINAGTATVTIKGTGNYTGQLTRTFLISKAEYDMEDVTFSSRTFTYDGKSHNLSISGELPEGLKVSYSGNGLKNPGTTTVTATFTGDSRNYEPVAPMKATLTIKPAAEALNVKYTVKKSSVSLKWNPVKGATSYRIYAGPCSKKNIKQITTVKGTQTSWIHKKLKKNTYYKYYVAAYNNSGKLIESVMAHVNTGKKEGKPVKIQAKISSVSLVPGKTTKLKATVKNKGKVTKHTAKIRYVSSDPSVASVNTKGTVKAIRKGTCKIFCYTQNGLYTSVNITVK